jgi:TolB-like protein/Flp pilus assembly protein TadD
MSPEQARGEEVDQRSDVFSLGAVLYEMITGRRPFKGEHEAAVMYSVMNETPEPLARYKSNTPDELQRVIDKALAKEKDKRYQHVDEMAADLRSALPNLSSHIATASRRSKVPWMFAAGVLALVVAGIYLFYPKSGPTSANSKTIAVLPFNNMSGDQQDEYFSDGIMEDIMTQLSKIADLNVISRTTMMQYKNTKKPLKEIGKELNAGVVLEGSVRHSGNRIRIASQLIDAETDRHLWAETYDREMQDVFAIQSDVAKAIASALKAKLSPGEKERIEKKQTENTEAYQLYLKGRFYWNKRTVPDLQKSIEYFNQAIEKDPNYALAYAGLANSYVILPAFGLSAREHYQKAQQAATKALEFDSTLAEVHTVLGNIKENQYDLTNAESEYKRAIELNPSYPTAHQWYGSLLVTLGRFNDAIAEARRAVELDPLSLIINYNLGVTFYYMRQYNQAIDQCNKGIELDPTFPWSYYPRGLVAEVQGKLDEAIKDYQKARLHSHNDPTTLGDIGRCWARAERKDDALKTIRELREYLKQGYSVSYAIANVYYGLGDTEKTFEWLERSIRDREGSIMDISSNPIWDNLRSDPRFIALLKKMGLGK